MFDEVDYDLGNVIFGHTRWNATHDLAVMVRFDPDPDGVANDCEQAGYRVLVSKYELTDVFRVNYATLNDVLKAVETTDSNRVFYIEYDFDERTFSIHAEEPSKHFAGIIVVDEAVEDRTAKLNELNSQFTCKRIFAYVEGLVYEPMIVRDGKIIDSCSGIEDSEEAKNYYKARCPECIYSGRDFKKVRNFFILKSKICQ